MKVVFRQYAWILTKSFLSSVLLRGCAHQAWVWKDKHSELAHRVSRPTVQVTRQGLSRKWIAH